jgi:hypothetical protein
MNVELSPNVAEELQERAASTGESIDQVVARMLRTTDDKSKRPMHNASEKGVEQTDSRARVQALLNQWQHEEGLPPRPDGNVSTSLAELSAQWAKEFDALTPEEREAERLFEDEYEKGIHYHPVEI